MWPTPPIARMISNLNFRDAGLPIQPVYIPFGCHLDPLAKTSPDVY